MGKHRKPRSIKIPTLEIALGIGHYTGLAYLDTGHTTFTTPITASEARRISKWTASYADWADEQKRLKETR